MTMRSLSFVVLLALSLALSCRRDDPSAVNACGVRDPLVNLKWLRQELETARQRKEEGILTITAIEANGQTYIQVYRAYMSCSYCVLYHCDGRRVDTSQFSAAQWQVIGDQFSNPGNRTVLWPQ